MLTKRKYSAILITVDVSTRIKGVLIRQKDTQEAADETGRKHDRT